MLDDFYNEVGMIYSILGLQETLDLIIDALIEEGHTLEEISTAVKNYTQKKDS